MKVLKKQKVEIQSVSDFKIGDQIEVGKYTATCQIVTEKGALFFLDKYLDGSFKMNQEDTNEGGYEASNLRKELQKESILDIFSSVREMMIPFENGDLLRIPCVEELFDTYSSDKKQWPLMKDRKNRIATREFLEWGWLQNCTKFSESDFSVILTNGKVGCSAASDSLRVRPVFQLGKLKGEKKNESF